MSGPCEPKNEQNKQETQEDEATSNNEEIAEIQRNIEDGKGTQEIKEKEEIISDIISIEIESSCKIDIEDNILAQALENREIKKLKKKGSDRKWRIGWSFRSRRKSDLNPPVEGKTNYQRLPKFMVYFEGPEPVGEPLSYTPDRNDFVILVFSICGVMLLFTIIFVALCVLLDELREFMETLLAFIVLILMMIIDLVVLYVYMYSSCSRVVPCNYILNIFATIASSFICGFMAVRYAPWIVLAAALTTLVITLVCVGLAFTSFDFTRYILIVVIASIALFVASIICTILRFALGIDLTIVQMVILILSAVASSVMMVIEFQMILGGRSVELGEEEYTYGAYLIYTSIINLFLTIMRIMSLGSGGDD